MSELSIQHAKTIVEHVCGNFTPDTTVTELGVGELRLSRELLAADFMAAIGLLGIKEVRSQVMYPLGARTIRELAGNELRYVDRNKGEMMLAPALDVDNPRYLLGPVIYFLDDQPQFADGFAVYEHVEE